MEKDPVTLSTLFSSIDGQYYGNRMAMEAAVVDEVNGHITRLPVGYSYKDAIEGALAHGWFRTNSDGSPGVKITVIEEERTP